MRHRTLPDHRLRYRHLSDRRRLGFELERILARIERHPGWPTLPEEERRELAALVDAPLRPATDPAPRLEADVRRLTARLVTLAKALRTLDDGTPARRPA